MSDWTPMQFDGRNPRCPADGCDGAAEMVMPLTVDQRNAVPCDECGRPIQFGVRIIE